MITQSDPFRSRDLDLPELRNTLRNTRVPDQVVRAAIGLDVNQIPSLTETQALSGFNVLLDRQDLYAQVQGDQLWLPAEIAAMARQVQQKSAQGDVVSQKEIRRLNRALLRVIYPYEIDQPPWRKALKSFLKNNDLLTRARRIRTVGWDLLDRLFLRSPRWTRYLLLNEEPYSGTFQSVGKQERIQFCINEFLPAQLQNARVLDLGAGNGYGVNLLTKKYPKSEVLGLSINRQERRDGRRQGLNMHRADMHALPFPDNHFDWIFAVDVFEHALSPYILCCELNRVLKLGGQALLSFPEGEESLKAWYHFTVLEPWQMRILLFKTHLEIVKEGHYKLETGLTHGTYLIRKLAPHDPKNPKRYENAMNIE